MFCAYFAGRKRSHARKSVARGNRGGGGIARREKKNARIRTHFSSLGMPPELPKENHAHIHKTIEKGISELIADQMLTDTCTVV